ncbi:MAG: flagellar hook assembly protein FlgD [Firmicutes bacterium]|nr:flagellar hook assembly protein FlgD [Bacillota bacterium]
MMVTRAQGAAAGAADQARQVSRDLQDQFLKLLVAELKCQDPMSPLQDKEFLSQVAQISTLDSITQLKSSFDAWAEGEKKLLAASLVGKTVRAITGSVEIEGLVWGVRLRDGVNILVGDAEFGLEDVVEVR